MEETKYFCELDNGENCLKITFSGKMDTEFINVEMPVILDKVNECDCDVKLDLGDVVYVSSSFLRLCIVIAKGNDQQRRRVCVTRVKPLVKKVFKIAGFDFIIAD